MFLVKLRTGDATILFGNRLVTSTLMPILPTLQALRRLYPTWQIFSILVPPGEPMGSPQVMA
jgi:hypothetical protein